MYLLISFILYNNLLLNIYITNSLNNKYLVKKKRP